MVGFGYLVWLIISKEENSFCHEQLAIVKTWVLFNFRVVICSLSGLWSLIMKRFHFHLSVRFGRRFECTKEMQILD